MLIENNDLILKAKALYKTNRLRNEAVYFWNLYVKHKKENTSPLFPDMQYRFITTKRKLCSAKTHKSVFIYIIPRCAETTFALMVK